MIKENTFNKFREIFKKKTGRYPTEEEIYKIHDSAILYSLKKKDDEINKSQKKKEELITLENALELSDESSLFHAVDEISSKVISDKESKRQTKNNHLIKYGVGFTGIACALEYFSAGASMALFVGALSGGVLAGFKAKYDASFNKALISEFEKLKKYHDEEMKGINEVKELELNKIKLLQQVYFGKIDTLTSFDKKPNAVFETINREDLSMYESKGWIRTNDKIYDNKINDIHIIAELHNRDSSVNFNIHNYFIKLNRYVDNWLLSEHIFSLYHQNLDINPSNLVKFISEFSPHKSFFISDDHAILSDHKKHSYSKYRLIDQRIDKVHDSATPDINPFDVASKKMFDEFVSLYLRGPK